MLSHLRDFVYLADAVAEPGRRRDGREMYPGLLAKAAALLLAMLRLRPFASANARISLLATTVFLNRNGFDLSVDDDRLTRSWRSRPPASSRSCKPRARSSASACV